MKLWDGRNERSGGRRSNIGGPIRGDTFVQVDEPLTRIVVADDEDGDGETLDGGCKNVVHVRIPIKSID